MAYDDKTLRHDKQLKIWLNTEEMDLLRRVAETYGIQRAPLSREIIKGVIDFIEAEGKLPNWLEKKCA